jgi:hypothetical protein
MSQCVRPVPRPFDEVSGGKQLADELEIKCIKGTSKNGEYDDDMAMLKQ